MANRMILNETSYFGAGSISEIVTEAKKRAFKKALVVTDPDLIKFNVAKNVTDLLEKAGVGLSMMCYTFFYLLYLNSYTSPNLT